MLLPRTPSEGIYNPATPSGGYTPHFTPMESHYTPDQPTPRGPNEVSTPGYTPYTATPQAYPATPATPGIPQTPGTPGMMSIPSLARASAPATPGMISYDADRVDTNVSVGMSDEPWATEGIEVRVSEAYRGGQYSQATAVITSAGRDSCRVALRDRDGNDLDSLPIPSSYLEPVVPAKKDRVKVIRGELKGNVGLLVGIDGSDGIVKMEPNLDIKLLALPLLARYHHRK
jgi:transcription elongation factor SPT5